MVILLAAAAGAAPGIIKNVVLVFCNIILLPGIAAVPVLKRLMFLLGYEIAM